VFDSQTLLTVPVTERAPLEFATQAAASRRRRPGSRRDAGQHRREQREGPARPRTTTCSTAPTTTTALNRLVINPSLDAIQEFAIQQNTYDAEYGRSAGAQLNMVVKSGTRTLHGSAYEYFRNSTLQARDALDDGTLPRPELQRNQFGGTIGGPLWFPRSFFFINAEGIDGT
jgi:hypothetical protein